MTKMRVEASDFPDDKEYPDFESYIEAVRSFRQQTEDNIRAWMDSGIKEFSDKDGKRFGVVSPTFAAEDSGIGRITWYASYGFTGHVFFSDEKGMLDELITSLGYGIQPAVGSLDQLSGTEEWQQGMEKVREVQHWKKNQGVLLQIKAWLKLTKKEN